MPDTRVFCLDCGYPLEGLGEHRCPECGLHFDPADPGSYRAERGPLVQIGMTRDSTDAGIRRQVLADHGVHAVIMGESLAAQAGLGSPAAPAGIWVGEHDAKRATEILAALDEETHEPWTCPACGEASEGQFAACWNCGAERPALDPTTEP